MGTNEILPLSLGLILFSFFINSILIIPFIDLLYKLKLIRRKEAPKTGKIPLFDKLHDKKAGTPVGGGILIIITVSLLFAFLFPFSSHMGISIVSSFNLRHELFIIFFTFISFGILGFYDDYAKIFGKPKIGKLGMWFGLTRKRKFIIQVFLGVIISYLMYLNLGIKFLYIPLLGITANLGFFYIPFATFVIVAFSNAY